MQQDWNRSSRGKDCQFDRCCAVWCLVEFLVNAYPINAVFLHLKTIQTAWKSSFYIPIILILQSYSS